MSSFGAELRRLRQEAQLRQQDLVDRWGGGIARSTLANVEGGRDRPSPSLWGLVREHDPAWASELEPLYRQARSAGPGRGDRTLGAVHDVVGEALRVGGPFVAESVRLVYNFRHRRGPEEIIDVRRVRATDTDADAYILGLVRTDTADFAVSQEVLWGGCMGELRSESAHGRVSSYRTLNLTPPLRRGQTHEFAVRTWVEHDPEPDTDIQFEAKVPTKEATILLNFFGERPSRAWAYGPVPDESFTGRAPRTDLTVAGGPQGCVSAVFPHPLLGHTYGIAWEW